jgi:endonuclease III
VTKKQKPENRLFAILKRFAARKEIPSVHHFKGNPFLVMISCLLSLRTREQVTLAASRRLFEKARTAEAMRELSSDDVYERIRPVLYASTKAKWILSIAQRLESRKDQVPSTLDELLEFPGVGRKTANLVLTTGFDQLGICVDTHVHRIVNRWGYVRTSTPDQTEFALRKKLPKRYWKTINTYLVAFGRYQCLPVSPKCSTCPLIAYCDQVAVTTHR